MKFIKNLKISECPQKMKILKVLRNNNDNFFCARHKNRRKLKQYLNCQFSKYVFPLAHQTEYVNRCVIRNFSGQGMFLKKRALR